MQYSFQKWNTVRLLNTLLQVCLHIYVHVYDYIEEHYDTLSNHFCSNKYVSQLSKNYSIILLRFLILVLIKYLSRYYSGCYAKTISFTNDIKMTLFHTVVNDINNSRYTSIFPLIHFKWNLFIEYIFLVTLK